jgi:hypothetical protein
MVVNTPATLKIALTPEQQRQVREQTGQPVTSLKLQLLETRLTPGNCLN